MNRPSNWRLVAAIGVGLLLGLLLGHFLVDALDHCRCYLPAYTIPERF